MERIEVALGERSYPIHIGTGALDALPNLMSELGASGNVAIVTDSNVGPLYASQVESLLHKASLEPVICTLPAGEQSKRLERIEELTTQFLEAGLDRSSMVIALGGGVVGDVAGFAAAVYMRGVRYINIPTTIVAQVDSSVGGKTGVNHPLAKNIIGAFHQPVAVVVDTALLESLPDREFRAGMAEVIKHGMIADPDLFGYVEVNAQSILAKNLETLHYPIRRSCEIKAAIVAEDEREQGVRANLNYGHTFGHAIEAVTDYGEFLHGEAIALGMIAAAELSRSLDLLDDASIARQRRCLEAYGLPTSWDAIPLDATLDAMQHDKKARGGALKFILADRIGHVVHRTDVDIEHVRAALQSLRAKEPVR